MSKGREIEALHVFCETIRKIDEDDPGGAYFADMSDYECKIVRNIQNDFPPLTGIYISKEEVESLKCTLNTRNEKIAKLQAELKATEEWDIRVLLRKRDGLRDRLRGVAETTANLEVELAAVDAKLFPLGGPIEITL